MAFLLGVLLAFGRMASDSEIVALRAVGVSPGRLLAPVMMLATAMTAVTFYVNAVALPAANQAHRELVFSLVVSKARTDVKARTFTDSLLPGQMMLYVQDIEPDTGRWKNLLIHDTRDAREPKLILARTASSWWTATARSCASSWAPATSTASSRPTRASTTGPSSPRWAGTSRWTSSSPTAGSSSCRRETAR